MNVESSIVPVTERTVIGKTVIDGRRQSNAGAIALSEFLVVIDPSPEAFTAPEFRKAIEKHFKLPIKYLLTTHYHGDHIRGLEAFQDVTIVGSKILYDKLVAEGKQILPEILFQDTLLIQDKDSVVEFHYAGGHTDCSTYAYFPREKVLFAGDLVFAEEFPWAGDSSCNPDEWIAFYEYILELGFEHLIPGHGPLVGTEEITKQLALLRKLKDDTLIAIKANAGPDGIADPTIYPTGQDSRIARTKRHFYNFYSNKK